MEGLNSDRSRPMARTLILHPSSVSSSSLLLLRLPFVFTILWPSHFPSLCLSCTFYHIPPPPLSLLSSLCLFYVQRSSSVNTQISTSIIISNQNLTISMRFPKQHVLFRFVCERVYSVCRTQLYPIGWYIIVDSCNILYKAASFLESSL